MRIPVVRTDPCNPPGRIRSTRRRNLAPIAKGQDMSFSSQATNQKFPFRYGEVFEGLVSVLPNAGLKVVSADKVIGRITAKTGMSLFSYGENVALIVERIDEQTTEVGVESSLKVGINVAGGHRHAKNFEKIISALSDHLQRPVAT